MSECMITYFIHFFDSRVLMLSKQEIYIEMEDSEDEDYKPQCGKVDMVDIKNENRHVVTLGKYDPKRRHRSVHRGLNLQGTCRNQECAVYQKEVWIQKGYGHFNIAKIVHQSQCPICGKKVPPQTVLSFGYRNCRIKIQGKKVGEEDEFTYSDQQNEGKLIKFKNFETKSIQWQFLQMDVQMV